MADIRNEIKQYLENINLGVEVKIDRFRAYMGSKESVDQILVTDMPDDRQPQSHFCFSKIAVGVKMQGEKSARDLCEQIEYNLSNVMGKLIVGGTAFDKINLKLKTTFIGYNSTENSAIYECQFEFLYKDLNLLNYL